ncbi:hypothetical protein CBS147372_9616 [Penicillium roqueforti]|nr:hypothetical protein CBS147372_9616 [Penicillium roqueforti]
MSRLIVILGITGVQKIRGVTRNPESDIANEWASKGVEIVRGDLDDLASLKQAFVGGEIIFGVTDFWTIFKDPESQNKKNPNQELVEYCYDVKLQQGKNIADAAATVPGLAQYIFSSMAHAKTSSNGKFAKLYHMDSKAEAVLYAQSLPGLVRKFSQIQAPIYFQLPWAWGLPTTPMKTVDGTWWMAGIGPGDKGIPFGHVRKDLGPCVKAIAESKPNVNLFALGEYVSWSEYLRTFCETQGLQYSGYNELSYERFCELLPGGLGHEFAHNVLFAFEFGYEGVDPAVIRPENLGLKMTSFREYCRETDFSALRYDE